MKTLNAENGVGVRRLSASMFLVCGFALSCGMPESPDRDEDLGLVSQPQSTAPNHGLQDRSQPYASIQQAVEDIQRKVFNNPDNYNGSRYVGPDEVVILDRDSNSMFGYFTSHSLSGAEPQFVTNLSDSNINYMQFPRPTVSVSKEYLGFFHNSAPDPMVIPKTVKRLDDQSGVYSYTQSWINSEFADKFSAYGYRRIKTIRFVESSDMSFYDASKDVIYINIADKEKYGAVVLDHELTLAGLKWARRDRRISWDQYKNLKDLNVRRFGNYNGYIGNVRGLFDTGGIGAGKAFSTGHQYAKLKAGRANGKYKGAYEDHAYKFIKDVEDNDLVSHHPTSGARIYLLGSSLEPSEVLAFINSFRTGGDLAGRLMPSRLGFHPK